MAACDNWETQPPQVGRLEARWAGSESGRVSAPAAAEWCADRLWLEIRAIQGDTGLAMVLYPMDSIASDSYRVVAPTRANSAPRSASVALRLFSQTAIKGYQGDSGVVILKHSSSGELSGRVAARARSVLNGAQIRLTGRFDRVAVTPQERGCAPASADTVADTTEDGEPVRDQVTP